MSNGGYSGGTAGTTVAAIATDLGDASAAGVTIAQMLLNGWFVFALTGTPTATAWDLVQVTGGPTVPIGTAFGGGLCTLLSGALNGQSTRVTGYSGGTLTVPTLGSAPVSGDLVLVRATNGHLGEGSDAADRTSTPNLSLFSLLRSVDTDMISVLANTAAAEQYLNVLITAANNVGATVIATATGAVEITRSILYSTGLNTGGGTYEVTAASGQVTAYDATDAAVANLNAAGKQQTPSPITPIVLQDGETISMDLAGGGGQAATLGVLLAWKGVSGGSLA